MDELPFVRLFSGEHEATLTRVDSGTRIRPLTHLLIHGMMICQQLFDFGFVNTGGDLLLFEAIA